VIYNVISASLQHCVHVLRGVSVRRQIRDACSKKHGGVKCRRGIAPDTAAAGVGRPDAENKTKTAAGAADTDAKFSPARQAPGELVCTDGMWEDISDASETSGEFASSCSDLSPPQPATVTVVGNGLIQVAPADPLLRRMSLGSDESKLSTGGSWQNGDGPHKQRCVWDSCDEVIGEREPLEDLADDNGHPRRLVQLQNILPLFIFGTNSDGSRSVRLAVIGDHKLNSEYLWSPRTAQSLAGTVSYTAEQRNNATRNNISPQPKSASRLVSSPS